MAAHLPLLLLCTGVRVGVESAGREEADVFVYLVF